MASLPIVVSIHAAGCCPGMLVRSSHIRAAVLQMYISQLVVE